MLHPVLSLYFLSGKFPGAEPTLNYLDQLGNKSPDVAGHTRRVVAGITITAIAIDENSPMIDTLPTKHPLGIAWQHSLARIQLEKGRAEVDVTGVVNNLLHILLLSCNLR